MIWHTFEVDRLSEYGGQGVLTNRFEKYVFKRLVCDSGLFIFFVCKIDNLALANYQFDCLPWF